MALTTKGLARAVQAAQCKSGSDPINTTDEAIMGLTHDVAKFIARTRYEDLPPKQIQAAKDLILDSLGASISGAHEQATDIVTQFAMEGGGGGGCGVVGRGFKTSLNNAALINGTSVHATELESLGQFTGSNAFTVIPVALAVAEKFGLSGKAVLEAVIIGLDVQVKIGMGGPGVFDKGFSSIGMFGVFGSTVAAGKLMGFTVEQMQHAIGIGISQCSGQLRLHGSTSHYVESGFGCRAGVTAAMLAKGGLTSDPNLIEGKQGFYELYSSDGRGYDAEHVAEKLGNPFCVSDIFIKKYGNCFLNHRSMDALAQMIEEHKFSDDDVAHVRAEIPPFIHDILGRFPEPLTGDDARFNLNHALAAILADGKPDMPYLKPFTDAGALDPRYKAARDKVEVIVRTDWTGGRASPYSQPVTVTLKSGQQFTKAVDARNLKGGADNPLSKEEMLTRHRNLTTGFLSPDQVERTIDLVDRLEQLDSITELMDIVTYGKKS